MTRFRLILALLLLAAPLAAPLTAVPAGADELMNIFMKNDNPRAIVVELFSRSRDMRWPGNDQVYLLEPGEKKSTPISCQPGEDICYGAWRNGDDSIRWGVGPDNNQACSDCCNICVKSSTMQVRIAD